MLSGLSQGKNSSSSNLTTMHPSGDGIFPVTFCNMLLVVTCCVELVVFAAVNSSEVPSHMVFSTAGVIGTFGLTSRSGI